MEATAVKTSYKVTGFEIPVENKERAGKFYSSVFGWNIANGEKGYSHIETVEMDQNWVPKEKGAVNGGMYKREAKSDKVALMITVDSITDTLKKAKDENGRVITGKTPAGEWGWWAEIADTEGNIFELWENS